MRQEFFIVWNRYETDEPRGIFTYFVDAKRKCYREKIVNFPNDGGFYIQKIVMDGNERLDIEIIYLNLYSLRHELKDFEENQRRITTCGPCIINNKSCSNACKDKINNYTDYLIKMDDYEENLKLIKDKFVSDFMLENPRPKLS